MYIFAALTATSQQWIRFAVIVALLLIVIYMLLRLVVRPHQPKIRPRATVELPCPACGDPARDCGALTANDCLLSVTDR